VDPIDGKPLLARYDLAKAAISLSRASLAKRRARGLWRWWELLPVRAWENALFLGEGATPLLDVPRLGSHYGVPKLRIKADSLNPTGSFKARGMAVAVSRAAELGVKRLVVPSAGNAGGALSAYAAAAGIPTIVIMPADAPFANQVEVALTGAELILLDGLISDCGRLARVLADELGAFDVSTLKEPYRLEGKKTMGLELAEDLNWHLPDVVIYPTGGGTGLIGMWKGFDELQSVGLIDSVRPRMFSVQPEGCAPIVRSFKSGERFATPWEGAATAAGGLRVPNVLGDFLILDCLRASGGGAVAVPESDLVDTRQTIGRLTGLYLSLETSAAVAAVPNLLAEGRIGRDDSIVVFDTGSGFKSEPPTELPAAYSVGPDPRTWESVIDRLIGRESHDR